MANLQEPSQPGNMTQPSDVLVYGPVEGALPPLMRINGNLYVVPNTLHFYCPAVTKRPAKKETNGGDDAGETQNRE